ncbi:MAG: FAD-dependent oxidoreductase [Planctomycetota bacterium]|jgi:heterodisulfide reductase subunit A
MKKEVLVIGGGIAGMQSALLLAEKDHHVYVIESAPAIGGFFPLLDRQFPTNSCGVCFMSPKPPAYCPIYESEFHENIEILTNCEVKALEGQAGDFTVSFVAKPRYVDVEKCNLCGKCREVCPVEVDREIGGGLEKRKAIYLPFAQAIPRCYMVDDKSCTRCGECVKVCEPGAINLDDGPRENRLNVGAVVLGFGFEPFRGEHKGEYGFGRYANVVSSIQYERMLSFAGPTEGLPARPSDGERPKKVAFIQCVGSRDPSCGQDYCSSTCCMYATKQAMVSRDRNEGLDAAIFYMDIRTMGKDYERYYERAKDEYGIRYIRSAVSTVRELQRSKRLLLTYGRDDGELVDEEFDMVVLSVGFVPPASVKEAAGALGVELNEYDFCLTQEFKPTETSVPGIFVAGAFREPRDIPETVVDASGAAADVSRLLDDFEQKPAPEEPPAEIEIDPDEEPRIGVFICDSKGALAEALEVDRIVEDLKNESDVASVESVDVTTLAAGVERIKEAIDGGNLNRALIAGCRCAALSKVLRERSQAVRSGRCVLQFSNIGEQCASVHVGDPAAATIKAKSLLHAAVERARLAVARGARSRKLNPRILVVGGGIAGLAASLALAEQGMDVTLVEKRDKLGGNALYSHYTLRGSDIQGLVKDTVSAVEANPKIEVLKKAQLKSLEGTWGNFRSLVTLGDEEREILHGAVIVATGGQEVLPEEYLFGENDRVLTQRTFERLLATNDKKVADVKTVVMIQCVGSRDDKRPYCSRICCGHAVKNALKLKETHPDAQVYVLTRDVRTYGFSEKYYLEARKKGVIFVRYEPPEKPEVSAVDGKPVVSFVDNLTAERMEIEADLLILSVAVKANEENIQVAQTAGLEVNEDGFFVEANPKAAPLDAVDRGKYFCGLCHSPNHLEDVICQGKAAAERAATLLWQGVAELAENIAYVNERRCSACELCVAACPYQARVLDETTGKVKVLEELCKGCGTCVIACPNGASEQYNFERSTVMDVLDEMMA